MKLRSWGRWYKASVLRVSPAAAVAQAAADDADDDNADDNADGENAHVKGNGTTGKGGKTTTTTTKKKTKKKTSARAGTVEAAEEVERLALASAPSAYDVRLGGESRGQRLAEHVEAVLMRCESNQEEDERN